MKVISKRLLDTEKVAKDFIKKISTGVYDRALVVGLYGDLGSGKTTFTQAIARILNIKEDVTSPTFVIEKKYPITWRPGFQVGKFKKLIHIDAYRLDYARELLALDWDKVVSDPKNIILIEWPERVLEVLPKNHMKIFFRFLSESEREITI